MIQHTLSEQLKDDFLGTRVDRGETTCWVQLSAWREVARLLKENHGFITLSDLTAIDYLDRTPRFDISAVLMNPETMEQVRVKTMLGEDEAADSWTPLWTGANWYEREIFDLFGIRFNEHPNLVRILLPADYQGHPLRKDYPVTGPPASVYR